jgi:PST family polysaccharide transporter
VIIGSVLGSTSLGYYSLSYRFIELPISQAAQAGSNVALPLLALMEDQHRFRTAFLRTQKVLVWAVAPIGVCSLFLGDIAVTTILGEKWSAAGPIVQVFGAVGLIQAATSQVGSIYLARDATGLMFKWGLAVAPAFIVSVLVGLPFGPLGVAWSYLALNLVLFYPLWAVPGPLVGLTPGMVVKSLTVELGWALAVAGGGGIVRTVVDLHGFGLIALAASIATCVYWAGALALDRTLRRDALGVLRRRHAAPDAEAVGMQPVSGPAR